MKIFFVLWGLGLPVWLFVADYSRRWIAATGSRKVFRALGEGFRALKKRFLDILPHSAGDFHTEYRVRFRLHVVRRMFNAGERNNDIRVLSGHTTPVPCQAVHEGVAICCRFTTGGGAEWIG